MHTHSSDKKRQCTCVGVVIEIKDLELETVTFKFPFFVKKFILSSNLFSTCILLILYKIISNRLINATILQSVTRIWI